MVWHSPSQQRPCRRRKGRFADASGLLNRLRIARLRSPFKLQARSQEPRVTAGSAGQLLVARWTRVSAGRDDSSLKGQARNPKFIPLDPTTVVSA